MNKKLILGAAAGVAAVALAVGGTTYSAWSDFGSINNNTVGAGFLKLDLSAGNGSNLSLDYQKLDPGAYTGRNIWIASNDGQSVPNANLYVTLHNLQDSAAPCATSNGKTQGEITSGVTGCSFDQNGAPQGTPAQGNLSRVLSFGGYYYPTITDPAACAALTTFPQNYTSFFASNRGDLNSIASGNGTKYELDSTGNTPLVLDPGQGACVGVGAGWVAGSDPASPTPTHPSDNSAQGDSMTFDVRFDLVQA
jgi:hypothetical protein